MTSAPKLDPETFDPYYLIGEFLPQDATLSSRTIVAIAIRNPDWSMGKINKRINSSPDTVGSSLRAFYRGSLKQRSLNVGEVGSVTTPIKERTSIDEFTKRQQAVIEFAARWPDLVYTPPHDGGWTHAEVGNYIAERTGLDIMAATVSDYASKCEDFIETYREKLREDGTLDDAPDEPTAPEEVPDEIRAIIEARIWDAPEENLDDGSYYGEDDWMEPYASNSLITTSEMLFPHRTSGETYLTEEAEEDAADDAGDDAEGETEDDVPVMEEPATIMDDGTFAATDERIEIDAGNATYTGPSSGVVVGSSRPTQTISEAPAYQKGEEDDADEAAGEATDEDVRELLADASESPVHSPFYDMSFDAITHRLEDLIEQAEREHELHPSEATAARLAAYERSMDLIRGFRPDEDDITIHDEAE